MKKLQHLSVLVIMFLMVTMLLAPAAMGITDYWCKMKPYTNTTYDEVVGNAALGDFGGISIGAHVVKYADWGALGALLIRFSIDTAIKDEYRNPSDPWMTYYIRWVKLEFLETLNPDYTSIESHDFAAYNLKLSNPEDVDAGRYEQGAHIIWDTNSWSGIDEASAYCDIFWIVYDGISYHEIKAKATVCIEETDTCWGGGMGISWEHYVETSVTFKLTSSSQH